MFSLCGLCWNTDWILYNLLIVNSDRSYISDELLHKLGNVVVTYHKKVREILCFFYSWFDMTSGTTAERQTQTVNLIRQFYAFILNSVSDVIFFFLSKVQVQNTYVSVSVPLKAGQMSIVRLMAIEAVALSRATVQVSTNRSPIMRHQRRADLAIALPLNSANTSRQQPFSDRSVH